MSATIATSDLLSTISASSGGSIDAKDTAKAVDPNSSHSVFADVLSKHESKSTKNKNQGKSSSNAGKTDLVKVGKDSSGQKKNSELSGGLGVVQVPLAEGVALQSGKAKSGDKSHLYAEPAPQVSGANINVTQALPDKSADPKTTRDLSAVMIKGSSSAKAETLSQTETANIAESKNSSTSSSQKDVSASKGNEALVFSEESPSSALQKTVNVGGLINEGHLVVKQGDSNSASSKGIETNATTQASPVGKTPFIFKVLDQHFGQDVNVKSQGQADTSAATNTTTNSDKSTVGTKESLGSVKALKVSSNVIAATTSDAIFPKPILESPVVATSLATTESQQANVNVSTLAEAISRPLVGGDGSYSVVVAMHPAELGHVQAVMSLNRNELVVSITAQSQAGHDVMANSIEALKSQLTNSGLNVTVTLHNTGHGGSGGLSNREQADSKNRTTEPQSSTTADVVVEHRPVGTTASNGQIHVVL